MLFCGYVMVVMVVVFVEWDGVGMVVFEIVVGLILMEFFVDVDGCVIVLFMSVEL